MGSSVELWSASLADVRQVLNQPSHSHGDLLGRIRADAGYLSYGSMFTDGQQDQALRELLSGGPFTLSDPALYWGQLGCVCSVWSWAREGLGYSFRDEPDLQRVFARAGLPGELPGSWLDNVAPVDVGLPADDLYDLRYFEPDRVVAIHDIHAQLMATKFDDDPDPDWVFALDEARMWARDLLVFLEAAVDSQDRAHASGR